MSRERLRQRIFKKLRLRELEEAMSLYQLLKEKYN